MKRRNYFLLIPALLLGLLLIPVQAQEPVASCSGVAASCSGSVTYSGFARRTPVRSSLAAVRNRVVNRKVAPVRNTLLRLQSVRASCGG